MSAEVQLTTTPLLSVFERLQIHGMEPRTRDNSLAVRAQWYEGSRYSPDRGYIWQPIQDAKKDLNRFTRQELNKAAEKMWKDSPMIRGLIKRLTTLIIGSGAYATPKTSSEAFNQELKQFLKEKFKRPCIDNKKSFANYQRKKMRAMLLCGESFTLKVTDPLSGTDKIQGLEWYRCSGAGGKPENKDGSNVAVDPSGLNSGGPNAVSGVQRHAADDGIEFYETGYPKNYRFTGLDAPVAENLVIHHALIDRDDQVRGETILAACLNTARDMHEILHLEKMAVKDASAKQDIIQTLSGDYDPESIQKMLLADGANSIPMPPSDDTAKIGYYNNKFGGSAVLLKTGDKHTPYVPARPGSAWEGFMAFLGNTTVVSTGLPPSLLLPIDIGGTDIRRDLQIGQKVVEIFQDDFCGDLQEVAEFFIQGGIEDRVFKTKVPSDWNALEWHFPGSLTVDRNRDADRRDAVSSGLLSTDEYFGEMGQDGKEQRTKIIAEVKQTRFEITGIPITEPFASATEFKQYLNLSETSSISFREMDAAGEGDGSGGSTAPKKKTRQPQPA